MTRSHSTVTTDASVTGLTKATLSALHKSEQASGIQKLKNVQRVRKAVQVSLTPLVLESEGCILTWLSRFCGRNL